MRRYRLTCHYRHRGLRLAPGAVVELGPDEAARIGAALAGSDSAQEAPAGDSRQTDAIAEAIRALDPGAADAWTKSGKPDVRALEQRLGYDITAAERDAAWEQVEQERGS